MQPRKIITEHYVEISVPFVEKTTSWRTNQYHFREFIIPSPIYFQNFIHQPYISHINQPDFYQPNNFIMMPYQQFRSYPSNYFQFQPVNLFPFHNNFYFNSFYQQRPYSYYHPIF